MRKNTRTLCIVAVVGCLAALPSWVAETKAEYKEKIASVRVELKVLKPEMKPICEENKASVARYKSVRLSKKETDSLSISKETWKKTKELHSQIMATHKDVGKSTGKGLRQRIKTAVKEKNFHAAIQSMDQLLELKKSRQDPINEIHQIWQQIDALFRQG